jgi:MOSC domain-containing protein YiiM
MTLLDALPVEDGIGAPSEAAPILLAGTVRPLTENRLSGIGKVPIPGPWTITRTGLVGDAQADLENHGGPEKALMHYPRDHYEHWRRDMAAHPLLESPGAFGENISTSGWTEALVHLGDVIRFGRVILQVSQGRQPCWKLNFRFGRPKMAFDVQTTGRTGWYYRVLEPGVVEPGDTMRIVERPCPDWPLKHLIDLLYKDVDDSDSLEVMADMPLLAEGWRMIARRRLATRRTEDWTGRLSGPKN